MSIKFNKPTLRLSWLQSGRRFSTPGTNRHFDLDQAKRADCELALSQDRRESAGTRHNDGLSVDHADRERQ